MLGEDAGRTVSREELCQIIEARMRETFELLRGEMTRSGHGMLPAGIILTGGAAQLAGTAELGREVLQMPVRVSGPDRDRRPRRHDPGPVLLDGRRACSAGAPSSRAGRAAALRVRAGRRRPRPDPGARSARSSRSAGRCARCELEVRTGRDRGLHRPHAGLRAVRGRRRRGRRRAALGVRARTRRPASWSSSWARVRRRRRRGARPAAAARRPLDAPPRLARPRRRPRAAAARLALADGARHRRPAGPRAPGSRSRCSTPTRTTPPAASG